MNVNNEITSLKEHLLYLDKTDDRHYIDKIVELYEKGVDEQTLQSIFWQRYEIEDWLRDKSLEGKDYTVLYKENEKGIFRSTTYKTEDVKQVWLSTIVAEDEDVTINMPTSFEEAHMLGMVGWCFCDNAGWWSQHTNPLSQDGLGEAIYFIHDILQANPDDYVTDMVKRDGSHEILNRKHHHLNVSRYLRSIGDMANKLVPTTMEITESKTNKNMKKNVVKINENTLRQIVAESVNRMLNEMKFGQEVEEYFGVLSNNEIRDIFMEWASNPEFEAAAKAFYGMIRKAADSRLDYTIRKSDGTITDKHGNPLTGGSGDNDAYTRTQEMRGPMGY